MKDSILSSGEVPSVNVTGPPENSTFSIVLLQLEGVNTSHLKIS